MKPERESRWERWLDRTKKRAHAVRLLLKQLAGDELVREWTGSDVAELSREVLLDVAQDHCDEREEACEFYVQAVNANGESIGQRALASRLTPQLDEALPPSALNAARGVSVDKIVAHLLNNDVQKEKIVLGFLGEALKAMGQLNTMQQSALATLQADNLRLQQLLQAVVERSGAEQATSDEERAEAIARTEALNKLGELGPAAIQLLMQHLAARLGAGEGGAVQ